MQYDSIPISTIVANAESEINSCCIPFCNDLLILNKQYLQLTTQVAKSCINHDITESWVIGMSALAQYEIDGAVGMYIGIFNNPFIPFNNINTNKT